MNEQESKSEKSGISEGKNYEVLLFSPGLLLLLLTTASKKDLIF